MLNKSKLAREILGVSGVALLVSAFLYMFLNTTAGSIAWSYCDTNNIYYSEDVIWAIESWINSVSFAASVIVFIFLFLFLVGQRIKKAEQKLMEKEESLRMEKESFIHALAHDIRTPLTSILSYSEYMKYKEDIDKSEIDDYIALMEQKAEQIKHLTNLLLDDKDRHLEKIEDGKLFMAQLLDEELAEELEDYFDLQIHMENCPVFSVEAEVQELRRIFCNLSSNIVKYASKEHPVWVNVYEEEGFLVVEQKNFIKKDISIKEGYGIGLESIRRIADRNEGDVDVVQTEEEYLIVIRLLRL